MTKSEYLVLCQPGVRRLSQYEMVLDDEKQAVWWAETWSKDLVMYLGEPVTLTVYLVAETLMDYIQVETLTIDEWDAAYYAKMNPDDIVFALTWDF